MKSFRQLFSPSSLACLFLLLLLFIFPAEVLTGAKSGLKLWFQIVLPTLLPFLITTNLCMELHIPELFPSFFYPVFTGLLSGYPVGAKACADMLRTGRLSQVQAQFYLSFCNNASPMFVLNYLLLQSLSIKSSLWLPLLLFYGSTFFSGGLFYLFHCNALKSKKINPKGFINSLSTDAKANTSFFPALDTSIMTGFIIITKIGGYILLFSILASLISAFLPIAPVAKGVLIGFLEITTGIRYLTELSLPKSLLSTLTLALTTFGGFSSAAQTNSVISGSGLSIWTYLKYKALAAIICTGLCILVYFF
ncbi:MAG: hypothetical protein ACOCNC_06050 [Acetivibrio ethanolgignens]